jgi:cell division protein FtsL
MKISNQNAIIIILIMVITGLSVLLFQSQKTIENQRVTIATQEARINELETEVAKLKEVSPEKIIEDIKGVLKDQGVDILRTITERALER